MSARLARLGTFRLGLAALCAFLVAVIALELAPEPGIAEAEAGVSKPAGPAPVALPREPAALAPLPQYAAIVERPLFDPSRRPPAVVDSAAPAVAADLRSLTLTGLVITPEARYAIFQDKSPEQTLRLAPGMRVGDWTLDAIAPDGVTFRRGGARERLPLYPTKEGVPAAAEAARVATAGTPATEPAKRVREPRRWGRHRRP